jgi:hypothetical protein
VDERLASALEEARQRAAEGAGGEAEAPGREASFEGPSEEPEERAEEAPAEPETRLSEADRRRIDDLLLQAQKSRERALALKAELDRLGAYREYEDRFLDLFRRAE